METLVFGVMFPEDLPSPLPLPTHLTRYWPITPAAIKWLSAHRAPSRDLSPPEVWWAGARAPSMQAQRTLLSLVLSVLLLSAAVALRGCSRSYAQLLSQLQNQANMEENTNLLLEPYIHLQDLDTEILRNSCMVSPSIFPSEDALRALSKPGFLGAVHATLGRVWHRLTAIQEQLLKDQDLPRLRTARQNIQGLRNNIHCLAWQLGSPLENPEPTQAGSGVSLTPTPALNVFWSKIKSCRLLWGYHRFIGSVGRVFREWEINPNRSRRHSPRRVVLHKGNRKTRPSRRGQRPVRRGQGPR